MIKELQLGNSTAIGVIEHFSDVNTIFKDSLHFIKQSLKHICLDFETKHKKLPFEHRGLYYENLSETIDWKEAEKYQIHDTIGYGEAIYKAESSFRKSVGESITTTISAPNMARRVMKKSVPYERLYVHTCPLWNDRLDKTVKGGDRFIGQKRPIPLPLEKKYSHLWDQIKEGKIIPKGRSVLCLDSSSLYPSAGTEACMQLDKDELILDQFTILQIKYKIETLTLPDIGWGEFEMYCPPWNNITNEGIYNPTLILHTENGNMCYTGYMKGTWRITDIEEAIIEGYIIEKINYIVLEKTHATIYKPLFEYLYNERLKALIVIALTLKIIANSIYGSMLLQNDQSTISFTENVKKYNKIEILPNGQKRYHYSSYMPGRSVKSHGAELLSIAKRQMNRYERKMGFKRGRGKLYGNTDCIIGSYKHLKKYIGKGLGKMKNDYKAWEPVYKSNGKLLVVKIIDWVFIDLNKYALLFNQYIKDGHRRKTMWCFHWTGISFVNWEKRNVRELLITGGFHVDELNNNFGEEIFQWYIDIVEENVTNLKPWVEKWCRGINGIYIDGKETTITSNCKSRNFISIYESIPIHIPYFKYDGKYDVVNGDEIIMIEESKYIHNLPKYVEYKKEPTEICDYLQQFPICFKLPIQDEEDEEVTYTMIRPYEHSKYIYHAFIILQKCNSITIIEKCKILKLKKHRQTRKYYLTSMHKIGEMNDKVYFEEDIPWDNMSLVMCTTQDFLIKQNKNSKMDSVYNMFLNRIDEYKNKLCVIEDFSIKQYDNEID